MFLASQIFEEVKHAEFFERYGFSVTVSLDGIGPVHDQLRPTKGGGGSYNKIMIQPVTFWGDENTKISAADQQILCNYFYNVLITDLGNDLTQPT